jgi:hypothetical protein
MWTFLGCLQCSGTAHYGYWSGHIYHHTTTPDPTTRVHILFGMTEILLQYYLFTFRKYILPFYIKCTENPIWISDFRKNISFVTRLLLTICIVTQCMQIAEDQSKIGIPFITQNYNFEAYVKDTFSHENLYRIFILVSSCLYAGLYSRLTKNFL